MVNDTQCISVTIMEDSNVLENSESFQMTLSAMETFIDFPIGQNNIIINVNEDPLDGLSDFAWMLDAPSYRPLSHNILLHTYVYWLTVHSKFI